MVAHNQFLYSIIYVLIIYVKGGDLKYAKLHLHTGSSLEECGKIKFNKEFIFTGTTGTLLYHNSCQKVNRT